MRATFVVGLFCLAALPAFGGLPREPRPLYREGEVIVRYREPLSAAARALPDALGMARTRSLLRGHAELLSLPAFTTTAQALDVLRRDPAVLYAEPNFLRFSRAAPPNDPLFEHQWGLRNTGQANFIAGGPAGVAGGDLNMLLAWDPDENGTFTRIGDPGVIVAVVDDAFDTAHEDLADNLSTAPGPVGRDLANNDADPRPDDSSLQPHGTMVAGCAVAKGNNGVGVAGAAWNARWLPLKVSRIVTDRGVSEAIFDSAAIAAAFTYAADRASIVNASFGGPTFSQAEVDAIGLLNTNGIALATAAGNDDSNTDRAQLSFPANYDVPNIIAVAATNRQDRIASYSQYGALTVDVAAPGLQIVTTLPDDDYTYDAANPDQGLPGINGTSFASPSIAGIGALILAEHPAATALEVRARLIEGAEPADEVDLRTVGGRVDAAASLDLVAQPSLVVKAVTLDANGVLDPGETTTLQVTLENLWSDATNIIGTLAAPDVAVTNGPASFGAIASGAAATASFTLSVGGVSNEHRYLPFTLDLAADGGYAARRRFLLELARLEGTSPVNESFAARDADLYDEFHAWHLDFTGFSGDHNELVIETTAAQDIDVLVKRDVPPAYNITVGINPETDSGFFCTSATATNCQDPAVSLGAGPTGNEQVVIRGAAVGTYHMVIVNFAQLDAGLAYTLRAFTRKGAPLPAAGGSSTVSPLLLIGLVALYLAGRGIRRAFR